MEQVKPTNKQAQNLQIEFLDLHQGEAQQNQPLIYANNINNNMQPILYNPYPGVQMGNNNFYANPVNDLNQRQQQGNIQDIQNQPIGYEQNPGYGDPYFFNQNRPVIIGIPIQQYQMPIQQQQANFQIPQISPEIQEKYILESRLRRASKWFSICNMCFMILVFIQFIQYIYRVRLKKVRKIRNGRDDEDEDDYYYDDDNEDDDESDEDGESSDPDDGPYPTSNRVLQASIIIAIIAFGIWFLNVFLGQYGIYRFQAKILKKYSRILMFVFFLLVVSLIVMLVGFRDYTTQEKISQVIFYIIIYMVLFIFYRKSKVLVELIKLYETKYGNYNPEVSNRNMANFNQQNQNAVQINQQL